MEEPSRIRLSVEDIPDPTLENVIIPDIPSDNTTNISEEKVLLVNISNSLREIDLGRDAEVRIEPRQKKIVSASVLEQESFKAFQSSFLVQKLSKEEDK
jgi:hypothetical protein